MHLDQNFIFIVIVAIIGITRALSHLASKARETADAEKRKVALPRVSEPQGNDTERIKKFLDALGRPDVIPPPLVKSRTDIPPRPLAPVMPPRDMTPFSPILPRREVKTTWPKKKPPVIVSADAPAPTMPTLVIEESAPAAEVPAYRVQSLATPPSSNSPEVSTALLNPEPMLASPAQPNGSSLLALLRSPAGLRNAVLLREIFGPARGLQFPDAIGF